MIVRRPALERAVLDGVVVVAADSSEAPVKLNGPAATIWAALSDRLTVAQLLERIEDTYQIHPALVRDDVDRVLGDLETRGLIER